MAAARSSHDSFGSKPHPSAHGLTTHAATRPPALRFLLDLQDHGRDHRFVSDDLAGRCRPPASVRECAYELRDSDTTIGSAQSFIPQATSIFRPLDTANRPFQ